jgi:hypothetical protein
MGVGYKGLGAARHLVLALDGVRTEGPTDERTGIWRWKRVSPLRARLTPAPAHTTMSRALLSSSPRPEGDR